MRLMVLPGPRNKNECLAMTALAGSVPATSHNLGSNKHSSYYERTTATGITAGNGLVVGLPLLFPGCGWYHILCGMGDVMNPSSEKLASPFMKLPDMLGYFFFSFSILI